MSEEKDNIEMRGRTLNAGLSASGVFWVAFTASLGWSFAQWLMFQFMQLLALLFSSGGIRA